MGSVVETAADSAGETVDFAIRKPPDGIRPAAGRAAPEEPANVGGAAATGLRSRGVTGELIHQAQFDLPVPAG